MNRALLIRLAKIEARTTGTGVAAVTFANGLYHFNGQPITEAELDVIERSHAYVIFRGEGVPHRQGMVTIERSYGR